MPADAASGRLPARSSWGCCPQAPRATLPGSPCVCSAPARPAAAPGALGVRFSSGEGGAGIAEDTGPRSQQDPELAGPRASGQRPLQQDGGLSPNGVGRGAPRRRWDSAPRPRRLSRRRRHRPGTSRRPPALLPSLPPRPRPSGAGGGGRGVTVAGRAPPPRPPRPARPAAPSRAQRSRGPRRAGGSSAAGHAAGAAAARSRLGRPGPARPPQPRLGLGLRVRPGARARRPGPSGLLRALLAVAALHEAVPGLR